MEEGWKTNDLDGGMSSVGTGGKIMMRILTTAKGKIRCRVAGGFVFATGVGSTENVVRSKVILGKEGSVLWGVEDKLSCCGD